jgi:hypothetical protein
VWAALDKDIHTEVQVPEQIDHAWYDHDISIDQFFKPFNISLYPYAGATADIYVFQLNHSPGIDSTAINDFNESKCNSTKKIAIYDAQFGSYWKRLTQQIRLIRKYPNLMSSFESIKYYGGYSSLDLFSIYASPRSPVAIGPNLPVYDSLYRLRLLSSWSPADIRVGKICFFGNLTLQREKTLRSILLNFQTSPPFKFCSTISSSLVKSGDFPFLVGSGLGIDEYPDALTYYDFCLCLPGGYPWAHRSFECGIRGAIPILAKDELPYFDGLLKSQESCITVSNPCDPAQWQQAISHALSLSQEKTKAMRQSLWNNFKNARSDLSGYLLKGADII